MEKKQKKTSVKHICIRLIGGCVNNELESTQTVQTFPMAVAPP